MRASPAPPRTAQRLPATARPGAVPRALTLALIVVALPRPARAELPCQHDDALARAAASVLGSREQATPSSLTHAARRAGSDAPAVRSLRVRVTQGRRVRGWLDALASEADAPLRCGEARTESARLVLAAAAAGHLDLDPGDRVAVRGELAAGWERPELVVRTREGLHRFAVESAELERGVLLPEELAPPMRVQLVARGPHGARPVAERSVGDEAALGEPPPGGDDVARRLGALRREASAGALRDNRLLREEAARHARAVCREGRVAHELRAGHDPERRLRARGLSARVVGEAVARATSRAGAMDALVASPSHQLTLLDRRFTDVGLAEARDERGRTCLVVLMAAWPRFAAP